MIKDILNNIFDAHQRYRGLDNHIRIDVENLITAFNNAQDEFEVDENNLLSFLRLHLTGEWRCEMDSETLTLYKIDDNWVRILLNPDGTIIDAYYV